MNTACDAAPGNPTFAGTTAQAETCLIVLTGNPNCGKTTLFNALTGLRAKVGNYAGVTVERKEGRLQGTRPDRPVRVLDLPGTYSLSPQSLDEQIARDVLLARLPDVPRPSLIVVVVDASNLERNLYYATQVIELGYPTVIALNMMDVARDHGHRVDASILGNELSVPVFPMVASTREGIPALRDHLIGFSLQRGSVRPPTVRRCPLPPALAREVEQLSRQWTSGAAPASLTTPAEALLALTDDPAEATDRRVWPEQFAAAIQAARTRLEQEGVDWRTAAIESRYARVAAIHEAAVCESATSGETTSDRLDRILTHKLWGIVIFLALMAVMFQGIFTFARWPMDAIETGVSWAGRQAGELIPAGDVRDLLVDGVVAGVGAVVVFLPQICLLFLFIGLLEDTGYMARAAFLMDRLMSKVGLHGKSFIPMLSSFACAIPGIMATRTIENPKDRLVTILVAPLMSCSARLPVYTLLIAACIPDRAILGLFRLPGLTLLGMYLLGVGLALLMAWCFKKTLLRGHVPMLIMELPPYRRPVLSVVLRHMWDRSRVFLRRAGTVILGINILLWFLATYPRDAELEGHFASLRLEAARTLMPAVLAASHGASPEVQLRAVQAWEDASPSAANEPKEAQALRTRLSQLKQEHAGAQLRHSLAGRLGHLIEPMIRPLGFDWSIGIGIVASFAAREIFVSTMSVVYSVGDASAAGDGKGSLAEVLRQQTRPDGTPLYTPLTGLSLMVFYVLAMQCVSTIAIVRRETNGWRWAIFQWVYMGALAWLLSFLTYQGGRWLGWG